MSHRVQSPIKFAAQLGAGIVAGSAGIGLAAYIEANIARRTGPVPAPYVLDGPVGDGPDPLRVLWLGDSLAAGIGAADPDGTLPRAVAEAVGGAHELRVLATPGATIADVNAHQVPHAVALIAADSVDVIVTSVGANDVSNLTAAATFRSEITALAEATTHVPTVLLSIPAIGCARRLAQPLRALAAARGATLDRHIRAVADLHPHTVYADIRHRPDGIRRRHARAYLSADLYHPSERGYRVWASQIAPVIAAFRTSGPAPLPAPEALIASAAT